MSKYVYFLPVLLLWSQMSPARQTIAKQGKTPLFLVAPSAVKPDARQYIFTRFSTFNGLSANLINNLVQDHKGYIWLATPNGLQRYDGNKFVTFKHQHSNPNTLPDDNVGKVYIDKRNRLWVSTADNRIGIFDTDNFIYREVPMQWVGERPTIYYGANIMETRDGKLRFFSGNNGYEYLPDSNKIVLNNDLFPVVPNWTRYSVFYDTLTGRTWMGCDSGVAMYDPATRHLNYRGHNPDKDKTIEAFRDAKTVLWTYADRYGRFFTTTWRLEDGGPRLHYYNAKTGERKTHNVSGELFGGGYHEINGIQLQRNGRLWIYGMPFIAEYTGGERPLQGLQNEYKDEQSLKFDHAYYMYEDRSGNLWVCTTNGVYLFNPDAQQFNAYRLLRPDGTGVMDGPTKCVLEADSNQLWVGTWGVGLYAYDKNFKPSTLPPAMRRYEQVAAIWCLVRHRTSGLIWMGMQDGAMSVYDPVQGKEQLYFFDIFQRRTIRQVAQDKQGNLWFGTQGGLVIKWTYQPGRKIEEGFTEVVRTGLVHKMFVDRDGYVWVGTSGHGLLKIDPVTHKTLEHYGARGPKGKRLWNDSPADMVQVNDSTLLIVGYGISLLNVRTGHVRFISTDEGLPSNNAMCVARDKHGIIWLGMNSGICRMNLEKLVFTYYDRRDGMPADYFDIDDAHHLSDGRLVFTSAHNFVVIDPEKMVRHQPPPDAVITDIRIANRSLPADSVSRLFAIHLQHDKSSISIEFGSFNFLRHEKMDYYYQLAGVDKDWIHADDRRQAIYNHLSPGNYVFKVKSINADGVASTDITSLRIRVEPPFWRTGWFYGSLALLAIGILYWIDRERMRRIRELQAMRTQIAINLHSDINTTLNNINMLSEMAKIKADKDLTRSKEYIEQISEKSHNMIIAMDDMLWSIDPQNDSMEKTLLRMLEFVDALINRHGANIDILVDEHVRSLQLDMKARHEMLLIFKEVLRNMVQESKGNHILINIDLIKSKLSLKIQDDGSYANEGDLFSAQALQVIGKRTSAIRAELDIQADRNGASVILLVPIG
ncbi:hypothetical protein HB364_29445 [Pseudoflavitalea sp. X16]|uniref:ligand-binding sensor domain-containing protein n=1 Tax=Paraflavitalea devenefica TaxID=2716334 RepID=UPI001421650B|nr:two-component regulator propeller domain-containing protein [Paraflavitalea devenefica]NII29241.1 hypothetical protein [Paraflavitalea devenefica]